MATLQELLDTAVTAYAKARANPEDEGAKAELQAAYDAVNAAVKLTDLTVKPWPKHLIDSLTRAEYPEGLVQLLFRGTPVAWTGGNPHHIVNYLFRTRGVPDGKAATK